MNRVGLQNIRQVRSFVRVYARLARLLWDCTPSWRLALVSVYDIVGGVAQGAVIAMVAYFVSIVQQEGVTLPFIGIQVSQSFETLTVMALGVLGFLIIAAGTTYGAAVRRRGLGRVMQVRLTNDALAAMKRIDRVRMDDLLPHSARLRQFVVRDTRQAGLALEILLRSCQPAIYTVVAVVIVLHFEPWLSLGVFALGLFALPPIYLVCRGILRNAREYYQSRIRDMGRVVSQAVDRIDSANAGFGETLEGSAVTQNSTYVAYLNSFDIHRLAVDRIGFVMAGLRAVAVSAGLALFGWLAMEGARPWSGLVGFVGGLIYLSNSLQGFFGNVALLNRFYPQVVTFIEFLDRIEAVPSATSTLSPPDHLRFDAEPKIAESENTIQVGRAETVVVVTDMPLRRHTFRKLVMALQRASNAQGRIWRDAAFVGAPGLPSVGTLSQAVLGSELGPAWRDALQAWLQESDLWRGIQALEKGLDTALDEATWAKLDPSLRRALEVASVATSGAPILFLGERMWAGLPRSLLINLTKHLPVAYLFLVTSGSSNMTLEGLEKGIVVADGQIAGMGNAEWCYRSGELLWGRRSTREDGVFDVDAQELEDEADLV